MIKLRDYQKECIDKLTKTTEKSNLIILPTGSGKTIIFLSYLLNAGKKSLVLAHTVDLVNQTYEVLKRFHPDFKFSKLNKKINLDENHIVIGTIQSLMCGKMLQRCKDANFETLIIDEAHHALSDSYQKAISTLDFNSKDKTLIGFTATPIRGDGQNISKIFTNEIFRKEIFELMEKGILTDIIGHRIKTGVSLSGIKKTKGDFCISQLTAVINTEERNELALESLLRISPNKKTIIFCSDINHSETLAKTFQDKGISCKAVHGNLPRAIRFKILEDFKTGKIQVITNCQLLTEGFDEPSIETVLIARPTRSIPLYFQMIGRGIRPYPNKNHCTLIELTDNDHSVITLPMIAGVDAEKENKYENGRKISEYKKSLKEKLNSDKELSIEEFSIFKKQDIFSKATKNQLEILQSLGVKFILPLSYEMANLMITNHKEIYGTHQEKN